MHRKAVAIAVVSLFLAGQAIFASGSSILRGELISDSPIRFHELQVEVYGDSVAVERASVSSDGRFEFRGIAPGQYRIRVMNLYGDVVREDFAQVGSGVDSLVIRLHSPRGSRPPGGAISARRLAHHPSKNAAKLWQEAAKASKKGDHAAAIGHLERSVGIDPEYFEAQHSLGDERVRNGDASGALSAYEKALEIDPSSAIALVSRGMVLLHMRKVEEALADARKALVLSGDPIPARYLLGLSLAVRGRDLDEALEHLKASSSRFPQARESAIKLEGLIRQRQGYQ